jgi:hypothetical protein
MKKLLIAMLLIAMVPALSCKKKSPDPPVPVVYTRFKVGGVDKIYYNHSKFSKDLCSSSTFCCRFYHSSQSDDAQQIKLGIPGDPIVGYVYKTGEYRFSCFYIDAAGIRYDLTNNPTSPFQVVFTQWQGQGGWAKGNFSGWMKSAINDSIQFTDGYFENEIWTMGTK